jgi:hypothetical protein
MSLSPSMFSTCYLQVFKVREIQMGPRLNIYILYRACIMPGILYTLSRHYHLNSSTWVLHRRDLTQDTFIRSMAGFFW